MWFALKTSVCDYTILYREVLIDQYFVILYAWLVYDILYIIYMYVNNLPSG